MTFRVINRITSVCFYAWWVLIALGYLCFYMFSYLGRGLHIDILSVGFMLVLLLLPTLLWKHQTKVDSWKNLRGEIIFTTVLMVLWLATSIILVIVTKGACVCYFNDNYGFTVAKDAKLSTEFTRTNTIESPCKDKQLCHLYATLPEDGSTGVFFNAHTPPSIGILDFNLTKDDTFFKTFRSS